MKDKGTTHLKGTEVSSAAKLSGLSKITGYEGRSNGQFYVKIAVLMEISSEVRASLIITTCGITFIQQTKTGFTDKSHTSPSPFDNFSRNSSLYVC